ncbi:MAG: PD40 domain-containing protein [Planctomycetes bacterium]|nr:PD40 domain-containing protein [Planctomycetota bacterium]
MRELGDYEGAIKDYDKAIMYTPEGDLQRAKLHDQRCEIYLRMGDYEPVIADAKEGLTLFPNETILHIRVFCALTALGRYEQARSLYRQIAGSDADDKNRFRDLSMKYVFDTLKAGRSWHPTDSDPHGIPFLAMLEAEEIYRSLGSKAAPLITDGFAADWYRDGTKLAFSLGVPGHSGVGTFDPASQETKLLIAPGTNPKWSPDGQYIAFIRDRQILPLTELTSTDRRSQSSPYRKQELWIMKADGTEPRRLAYGRWPSWSQDSKHVYNQSSADQMLYSISIEDMDAEPLPIMPLPHSHCSVSPDEKYCAYAGRGTLKIVDLALKSLVFDWTVPLQLWGGNWAPNGHEFSIGGYLNPEDRTGLWIYDLDTKEAAKILCGQITNAAWDPNGVKLAFSLGPPFYEIWVAGLDPNISTIEALGLGRTIEEHYQDMVDHYTDVIKSDLENADGCLRRSQYRYYLHDEEGVHADMDSYRSILNPPKATDGYQLRLEVGGDLEGHASFILGTPINLGPVVNSSFMEAEPSISADGLQLFFNGDRPGGSGNWDLWVTTRATTEDEWGTPDNLGSIVNSPAHDIGGISPDGLELYIASRRLSGSGSYDIWATKRAKTEDDWDAPVNLRAPINTSFADAASISANGLMLCIVSNRPNGHGDNDLWLSTRATKEGAWRAPVNLGATVNTLWNESYPCISDDGLTLFFSDGVGNPRPGGFGDSDIWVTTRKTADAEWSEPVNLGPTVNTSFIDRALSISVDGSTLYFCSNRPGGYGGLDVWQVSITLISRSSRKDGDADSVRRLAESDDGKEVMPQKNP